MGKPEYDRPTGLTASIIQDVWAEVAWRSVPYANYFKLQVSKRSDFDDARSVRENESPNVNSYSVRNLTPDTKYYIRVCVCNWEGARLSPWSAVKTFRTASVPA